MAISSILRLQLFLFILLLRNPVQGKRNTQRDATCDEQLANIRQRNVRTASPPNFKGTWVSKRCEIRPGPEFVVRKYHFVSRSRFKIFQFHYSDPHCSSPFYSLYATGVIDLNTRSQSLIVPGSFTYSQPKIQRVAVYPYTKRAALYLQTNAAGATSPQCQQFSRGEWQPREQYVILNLLLQSKRVLMDRDCTDKLGFTLNEMQLIRQDHVAVPGHLSDRELYLGSISTEFEARASHRPFSFQDVLVDVGNIGCVDTCLKIKRATTNSPPIISSPQYLMSVPYGRWVSTTCESQRQGRFLTRLLHFSRTNNTWEGKYFNYHDQRCLRPFYDIYARGQFTKHSQSQTNSDAINYDFFIKQLVITPQDKRSVELLNTFRGSNCGYPGEWKSGYSQDVTGTGGCGILGLYVPEVKQQTLKLEHDYISTNLRYLFVGQLLNTFSYGLKPTRPTSFQAPLVECRTTRELEPATYSAVETSITSPRSCAATPSVLYFYFLLILVFIHHGCLS